MSQFGKTLPGNILVQSLVKTTRLLLTIHLLTTHLLLTRVQLTKLLPTTLLLLCLFNCSAIRPNREWTYHHPPVIGDLVPDQRSLIWCSTEQGAQFMSLTGWFSPDCIEHTPAFSTYGTPQTYQVLEIRKLRIGQSTMRLIRCSDGQQQLWIPLPDHNWI